MKRNLVIASLLMAAVVSACSSGPTSSNSISLGGADPGANIDPTKLVPASIVGKGPNGETPAVLDDLKLSDADAAKAKAAKFKVGVVMQTMDIDWSTNQVRGITDTLKTYGAELIGVTDPHFKVAEQVAALQNMAQLKPDGIISIPVDDTATAPAYKAVAQAGIKLVFMDNVPRGLQYPTDYQSMISSDNQGDGLVAAAILAPYVPKDGTVGVIGFGVDFFVTKERVNGFKKWMSENRPDIKIKQADFLDPSQAGSVASNFITANPDVKGMFTVWEVPAAGILSALRSQGKNIPLTSINLAGDVAVGLAQGGLLKGVGAQRPYDQGVAEALAMIQTLLGNKTPQWVAVPALPVTRKNLLPAYQQVFHAPPPPEVVTACKSECGAS